MKHVFRIGDEVHSLWLSRPTRASFYSLHFGDETAAIQLQGRELTVDGIVSPIYFASEGDRLFIHLDGEAHELTFCDPVAHHSTALGGSSKNTLTAPMPGVAVTIEVTEEQGVREGETLMVIESMKLETAIRAPRDGVVEILHVRLGEGFDRDAPLITLAPIGDAP